MDGHTVLLNLHAGWSCIDNPFSRAHTHKFTSQPHHQVYNPQPISPSHQQRPNSPFDKFDRPPLPVRCCTRARGPAAGKKRGCKHTDGLPCTYIHILSEAPTCHKITTLPLHIVVLVALSFLSLSLCQQQTG